MEKLKNLLRVHEGVKLKPYKCTAGKLTIGVGRNLEDVGLTAREADYLLTNDIVRVDEEATLHFPWYKDLDIVRKDVVLMMIFNMGLRRFKDFKQTIAAIQSKDWNQAAAEMLQSKWADQVGKRAVELAHMMATGQYA